MKDILICCKSLLESFLFNTLQIPLTSFTFMNITYIKKRCFQRIYKLVYTFITFLIILCIFLIRNSR